MRKIKQFEMFGITYESKQFAAMEALEMVDVLAILDPLDLLRDCVVVKYDGSRVPLNTKEAISKEVKSCPNVLPPNLVLKVVMEAVKKHNFEFLNTWKGVKIPNRFLSPVETIESSYVEPIVATLINNGLASYKELEEYYSLYDAFSMFDAVLTKTVNEAYSSEAAAAEAKNKKF